MKIYIKKLGKSYSIYRVNRCSNNRLISGSFGPFNKLLNPVIDDLVDVHFSYPADGNLHYTLVLKNGQSIRGYWDKIVFRPSGHEITRDRPYPFFNLLPNQLLPKLKNYSNKPLFYQIVSSAFTAADGSLYFKSENASTSKPRSNDVVIDSSNYNQINVLGFLLGSGSTFSYNPMNKRQTIINYKIDSRAYPHIHTVVVGH